jgi:hypothetical protein
MNMMPKIMAMVSDRLLTCPVVSWLAAGGDDDAEAGHIPGDLTGEVGFHVIHDPVPQPQEITGTRNVGEQHDVAPAEIRRHERIEHVLAQHHAVAVDQHPHLEGLAGQAVVCGFIAIGGVVHQLQVFGKRDCLVHPGKGFGKRLEAMQGSMAAGV